MESKLENDHTSTILAATTVTVVREEKQDENTSAFSIHEQQTWTSLLEKKGEKNKKRNNKNLVGPYGSGNLQLDVLVYFSCHRDDGPQQQSGSITHMGKKINQYVYTMNKSIKIIVCTTE